ncbi:lamin tail domain-containing protein [Muricauda sp. JGD-17]|uniref:Lamin tail domain-containing protein n=1 Tax=Flagellimonas ochracea TaxID=2696472 RepID=A0A964TBN6_9FLAO|nr:DUF5689 domain-containing protein [Allomuricauda ochracea]NAY91905.1 lamin tail domain-containing protein [Allomuricauda ochracea]
MKKTVTKLTTLLLWIGILSCVETRDFDKPELECTNLESNITFAELDSLVGDDVIQIYEDLVLEGYVISSDKAGNFFNVLYLQNASVNPTGGIQVDMDYRESHLMYPTGNKVFVKLKNLYASKSGEILKLGGSLNSFGNISVGRLPTLKVPEHIILACDEAITLQPTRVNIVEIDSIPTLTLVQIDSLEFVEVELGNTFAVAEEETLRRLKDCAENEVAMLNSGYSDFQPEVLPGKNGSVTGIVLKEGKERVLAIRDLGDMDFINERCPEIITEFTTTKIFISELADPDNNSGARFVELYNSSQEPLDLNLWTLRRYTNDNTEVSSTIDLSGFIIASESTLVISPNAQEFELIYGFPPNFGVSTNSPADSNGDDNLELVDPFGTIIDVFGIIGQDGSGTNHEFEDGRAVRKSEIMEGNPNYTFEEWSIFNDTGDAGTIKMPQNAPEDFTPGQRE